MSDIQRYTKQELKDKAAEIYGDDPNLFGCQRDGFVNGYHQAESDHIKDKEADKLTIAEQAKEIENLKSHQKQLEEKVEILENMLYPPPEIQELIK